jgi:hypothetical protein
LIVCRQETAVIRSGMSAQKTDNHATEASMAAARALTRQLLGKNSKANVDEFLADRRVWAEKR